MINDFLLGGYWQDVSNRKKFFDDFARDNNFDALKPHNWYEVTPQSIHARKVLFLLLTKVT